MLPTAVVSGFYFSHPQAQYFATGKIDKNQVADYAQRKGMTLEEAERWLAPVLSYQQMVISECPWRNLRRSVMQKLKLIAVSVLLFVSFANRPAMAMGEKYREQGNALSKAIYQELIKTGLCKDNNNVIGKLPMYGGHGNQVNFSIYKPDRKILAATFEFLIAHGIEITGGVPIAIRIYPKSREEYGNIVISPKPAIQLEINE